MVQVQNMLSFPSPYGVTVIKSLKFDYRYKSERGEFPSPYGVTVIKS